MLVHFCVNFIASCVNVITICVNVTLLLVKSISLHFALILHLALAVTVITLRRVTGALFKRNNWIIYSTKEENKLKKVPFVSLNKRLN